MLVRMKNGNIEDLYDEVARGFVLQGRAEYLKDAAVLRIMAVEINDSRQQLHSEPVGNG